MNQEVRNTGKELHSPVVRRNSCFPAFLIQLDAGETKVASMRTVRQREIVGKTLRLPRMRHRSHAGQPGRRSARPTIRQTMPPPYNSAGDASDRQ